MSNLLSKLNLSLIKKIPHLFLVFGCSLCCVIATADPTFLPDQGTFEFDGKRFKFISLYQLQTNEPGHRSVAPFESYEVIELSSNNKSRSPGKQVTHRELYKRLLRAARLPKDSVDFTYSQHGFDKNGIFWDWNKKGTPFFYVRKEDGSYFVSELGRNYTMPENPKKFKVLSDEQLYQVLLNSKNIDDADTLRPRQATRNARFSTDFSLTRRPSTIVPSYDPRVDSRWVRHRNEGLAVVCKNLLNPGNEKPYIHRR